MSREVFHEEPEAGKKEGTTVFVRQFLGQDVERTITPDQITTPTPEHVKYLADSLRGALSRTRSFGGRYPDMDEVEYERFSREMNEAQHQSDIAQTEADDYGMFLRMLGQGKLVDAITEGIKDPDGWMDRNISQIEADHEARRPMNRLRNLANKVRSSRG